MKTKRAIGMALLSLFVLGHCKSTGFRKTKETVANSPSKVFQLNLASSKASQYYTVKMDTPYLLESPLSFLRWDQFSTIADMGMNVVDLTEKGDLRNISTGELIEDSCYEVGIYSLLKASHQNKLILISSLKDSPSRGLHQSVKIGDFRYCETETEIKIDLPNENTGSQFAAYFEQKGLSLVLKNKTKDDLFSNLRAMDHNLKDSAKISAVPIPRLVENNEGISKSFESIREQPFHMQLTNNKAEADLYDELQIEEEIAKQKPLCEGPYAKVYKVEIDGRFYAVRKEFREGALAELKAQMKHATEEQLEKAFDQRIANERLNVLIQNEFADTYKDLPFVRTQLAAKTNKGDFVSIMDYKAGGEFTAKNILKNNINESDRLRLATEAREQLEKYHEGITLEVGGLDYTASFFHRDLKGENIILDDTRSHASLIDFGASVVVLKDSNGNFQKLEIDTEGNLKPAKLTTAKIFVGTPRYMAPEIFAIEKMQEAKDLSPFEIFNVMKSIDHYAMNGFLYSIVQKKPYIPKSDIQEMGGYISQNAKLHIRKKNEKSTGLADIRPLLTIEQLKSKSESEILTSYNEKFSRF